MRLFRWFIVRQMVHEPLRSWITVAGIALGVAVVVAVRLANASALRGFERALEAVAGRTSLEIVGAATDIDELRVRDLGWLRQYGAVSPVIEADVSARPASPSSGPGAETLRVLGVDILRDRALRDYALRSGDGDSGAPSTTRFLELLRDERAIVLTERYARRHGLTAGGRVRLVTGDREREFVVNGLLADEGPARVIDGNFALMDIAAAQLALGRLGRLDRIDLRLNDPAAIDRAEAEIATRLPNGLSVQRPARRGRQVEQMLAAFQLNLSALSYVALLVGLFLVYNTVSVSVVARRQEVGVLRALGVTRRAVRRLFLAEAAALAVAGCAAGLPLGRAVADAAVSLTSATVQTLYIATAAAPPALGWRDVAVAMAVALPLSLLAAAVPAAEAARVPPLAAIRGADRLETRARLRWAHLARPGMLFAVGAWLATLGPIGGMPLAGYGAALAFVFAAGLLVPALLFAAGRAGRHVMPRLFRVGGWLANANLAGAIPRLSVSVAALSVGLSMMVAIAVMIGSFRETVVQWMGQTLRADLFVSAATRGAGAPQAPLSDEVVATVARHPAVEAVDRFRSRSIAMGGSQVFLAAGDFGVLLAHGNLLFKAPRDAREAVRGAIGRDAVAVSETFARRFGKPPGSDVEVPTPAGPQRFRVVAVYYDYSSDRGVVVMDRQTFARHFGEAAPTSLSVYLRPGADAAAVRDDVLRALGGRYRLNLYTNAALRTEVLRIFDATFAITYALEVIAVIVAIVGVAGTLLTLVLERRREIGVLRLVGADRRQVRTMVVLEAAMLGAVSQAVGLAVGVLLSLVLIYVINVQSFGWTIQFDLPALFLAQLSAAVLGATCVAGLYPARVAARLYVAEQVAEE